MTEKNINSNVEKTIDTNLQKYFQTPEFKNILEKAVKPKIEILTTHKINFKTILENFIDLMLNSNPKMKQIQKTKKKNRSPEENDELKDWIKIQKRTFKNVTSLLHHPEKILKLADLLNTTVSILNYIGKTELNDELIKHKLSINYTPLDEENSFFKNESTKETLKNILTYSENILTEKESDIQKIKTEIFEEINPENLFDKDENPNGLKPNDFNKIVTNLATVKIAQDKFEDKEKIVNYMKKQISNSVSSVNRNVSIMTSQKEQYLDII